MVHIIFFAVDLVVLLDLVVEVGLAVRVEVMAETDLMEQEVHQAYLLELEVVDMQVVMVELEVIFH
jgi:hypothetical protein